MSAQASGVFEVGVEPPPDSTEPSLQVVTSDGSPLTAPRSAWVIWPTFSSRVMAASSSSARALGLRELSIQGRAPAPAPAAEGAATSASMTRRQAPTAPRRMGRSTRRMTVVVRAQARCSGETGSRGRGVLC
jgi:hypothetical protein